MTERKAALITGAARRLGRAMALHLAAQGWDIGVHYRDSEADAQSVAKEVEQAGARCGLYQADLEDAAACERLIAGFCGDFPNAALLVNNASTFEHDTIASLSVERWTRQMTVNALTPILLARHFHDAIGGPGCIVNMLDQKVTNASPDFFSYTLSKMALCNATDLLAMAFSPKTRVNGIAPGLVLRSGAQTQEEYEEEHDRTPLGVGPTAQEICKAVAFIAGTPSMTGQVITLDGGRHMVRALKYEDLPGE
jgi:NAD(P)-dependent dehydrogenase (short-subunit alcohol dehydrogenase family)